MRLLSRSSILLLAVSAIVVAIACSQPSPSPSAPAVPTASADLRGDGTGDPLSAIMNFGIDTIGSPFPPVPGHDASAHAKDNIVPRTVVIDRGGTVTFTMGPAPVHAVAIYAPGTEPGDIDTSILTPPPPPPCPPVPLIDDPNNRVAVVSTQLCQGGEPAPTYTFTEPGTYFVICRFLPHFNVQMYGWVIVRDR
jgi:plastocyanin